MQTELKDPAGSPLAADLARLRVVFERGRYQEARQAAQSLLLQVPGHRELLYILAVSQRRTRRVTEAFQTLKLLKDAHPGFGRLFEELGFCYLAENAVTPAIQVLERAVSLNGCLLDSWRTLQGLYRTRGDLAASESAGARLRELGTLPEQIRLACEKYFDGETAHAEQLARDYLSAQGEHVEALRLLAKIAADAGAEYDAELILQRAVQLAPTHPGARHELGELLLSRQKHPEARSIAAQLLREFPQERSFQALFASAAAGTGDYATALPLFGALLQQTPEDPQLLRASAAALKATGQIPAAIDCLRRLAALPGWVGEGFRELAELPTYRFPDEELAGLQQQVGNSGLPANERSQLYFALARALEDRGRHGEAFGCYEHANALRRAGLRYRPEVLEHVAQRQRALCDHEFFAARAGFGNPGDAPIFIVGLPHSGAELIEQILASHSQIDAGGQLPHIPRMVQEQRRSGRGAGYVQILARLDPQSCGALGTHYLESTAAYRQGRPFFTDSTPHNFRHLDFIRLILPRARIIDVRREPLACCFAIYRQWFAKGQLFAYNMEEIARYYRMYVQLMDHWQKVLPGSILQVRYEELRRDPDSGARGLLDFCGLPFEPQASGPQVSGVQVSGVQVSGARVPGARVPGVQVSGAQVRKPLHGDAAENWRHFEPWLQPLRQALGPLVPE